MIMVLVIVAKRAIPARLCFAGQQDDAGSYL